MKLVVVDPYDNEVMKKVLAFYKTNPRKLSILDLFLDISHTMSKEDYKKEKESIVEISEMLVQIKRGQVVNVCSFSGTKDNRLIELEIDNLNDKNKKENIEFLNSATNYAFFSLNAETVTIFANEKNEELLISNGYESLGPCNEGNVYIKDKPNLEALGNMKK